LKSSGFRIKKNHWKMQQRKKVISKKHSFLG
jgi:hypothetical protein